MNPLLALGLLITVAGVFADAATPDAKMVGKGKGKSKKSTGTQDKKGDEGEKPKPESETVDDG